MKVIESVRDNRTGEIREQSWGNNITSDLAVISAVVSSIDHQREREAGKMSHRFQDRFTTVSITIEL